MLSGNYKKPVIIDILLPDIQGAVRFEKHQVSNKNMNNCAYIENNLLVIKKPSKEVYYPLSIYKIEVFDDNTKHGESK